MERPLLDDDSQAVMGFAAPNAAPRPIGDISVSGMPPSSVPPQPPLSPVTGRPVLQSFDTDVNNGAQTDGNQSSSTGAPRNPDFSVYSEANPAGLSRQNVFYAALHMATSSFSLILLQWSLIHDQHYPEHAELFQHLYVVFYWNTLLLAIVLEYVTTHGRLLESIKTNVIDQPLDALMSAIPAVFLHLQAKSTETGFFMLRSEFGYQALYDTRLLIVAALVSFCLRRNLTRVQWLYLGLLWIGSLMAYQRQGIVFFDNLEEGGIFKKDRWVGGFFVLLGIVFNAAFVVFAEYLFKVWPYRNDGPGVTSLPAPKPSLWMRSIQISFFLLLEYIYRIQQIEGAGGNNGLMNYFNGIMLSEWIALFLEPVSMLSSFAIIYYGDSLVKEMSSAAALIATRYLRVLVLSQSIYIRSFVGCLLMGVAIWLYSCPYRANGVIQFHYNNGRGSFLSASRPRSLHTFMPVSLEEPHNQSQLMQTPAAMPPQQPHMQPQQQIQVHQMTPAAPPASQATMRPHIQSNQGMLQQTMELNPVEQQVQQEQQQLSPVESGGHAVYTIS